MTHWTERLSEFLDGELAADERAACEAHLAACRECAEVLAELRVVTSAAQAETDRMPAADLWPGIHARIAAETPARDVATTSRVVSFAPAQRTRVQTSRQFVFTLPQLALAASLLIAVSAGVAYLAAGRSTMRPAAQDAPIQAQAELLAPSDMVERANFADAQFDQAISDLERVLTDRRDDLDPRTVMVIERNLAAIDQAIREARAALDADPANTFLNSHLADSRRKKLELLRQATMLQSPAGD